MKTIICSLCGRFFRGEGYNGVCTQACYAKGEYAKKHKKPLKNAPLYSKKVKKECLIQKSNSEWLKDERPKTIDKKERLRIGYQLETQHLRCDGWSGKQYKAARG